MTTTELVHALRAAGIAEVLGDSTQRAAYSSDASLYRVVPQAVVRPRHVDEISAALEVCRRLGVPLTTRGAGTSIAGNAVGTGVVLDLSRHLNRVHSIDPEHRSARVDPGAVHAALQRAAAPYGLRFGPDPSTHTRCTIGGMIGNNACGSRALAYGRTSDNVLALDVITGTGERITLDGPGVVSGSLAALQELTAKHLATVRTELGRFGRQVSGYALEHLLPENGFDVRRMLVGSEGTLAVVVGATMRLVSDPPYSALVVLGYPDMASAADAAPGVLQYAPTAVEGLDSRIVDALRERSMSAVPELPKGAGWLFVEVVGHSELEVAELAQRVARESDALDTSVLTDGVQAATLWRIREDGAGLAGRNPDGAPAWPGWEDAAVPPARLGAYLRDLDTLLEQHQLTGMPYGHFGEGCVHLRLDFPLAAPDGTKAMRAFIVEAATLVAGYGGSLSGEHGDGRARSELLPLMYSPEVIDLFGAVKQVFDPDSVLNPGVLVGPRPFDTDVRVAEAPRLKQSLRLALRHNDGSLSDAVHQCTGVGKCRVETTRAGSVMCPSYVATREEKDSTRGRARVLQEMVNGSLVSEGFRSPEVHEALDLCLSCKGCASDCPTGVDMATYKSEVLHQTYKGRLRPRAHYSLGQLPRWTRLASRVPSLANAVMTTPGVSRLAKKAAGVDARRRVPAFSAKTFHAWFARHRPVRAGGRPVLLFVDSFTDAFSPEVGVAAVRVLEDAGYAVQVTERSVCCGLTWITTGQLDAAARILGRTAQALAPYAAAGIPIVGLEPSCTAVLRSDIGELLDPAVADPISAATRTLGELLAGTQGWEVPSLAGTQVVAQPHCHQHAVMGWDTDEQLLKAAGAQVIRVGGCCGLAGNFGVEEGHYDVSVAIAESALLPAVRNAPDAVVLADGFSCRTQLDDLAGRRGTHLAQLLAQRLRAGEAAPR